MCVKIKGSVEKIGVRPSVFTHGNNFAYLINFSPQALKTDPEGRGLETCFLDLH